MPLFCPADLNLEHKNKNNYICMACGLPTEVIGIEVMCTQYSEDYNMELTQMGSLFLLLYWFNYSNVGAGELIDVQLSW